jgi:hypothetical protein
MIRMFWDAATEVDPGAAAFDEGRRFPICRPDPLRELFVSDGLVDVHVDAVVVPTEFVGFADLWEPFLGGQGPAPSYCATLPDDHRDALRDALRARLPERPDGTIPLVARAWAVRGRVPGRG